jgi:hypothetical protein
MNNPLSRSARSLEDAFFFEQDQELLARRRELEQMETTRKALSDVSGITSRSVLDKLVDLGITPEILAMLAVVPLVEVAWADRHVHKDEKAAVLAAADKAGFAKGGADYALLEQWLTRRPPAKLMVAWEHYIGGLCENLDDSQRDQLSSDILSHARAVAEVAGGFLGLTSPVSAAEEKVLQRMERAFAPKA